MKRSQFLCGIAALTGMLILILDGKTALTGANEGITLCIQSLIPTLFPFFVLSSLLTASFMGTALPILRPFGKLLGIPSGCESLLIPAYLGGYPAGAQCIAQAFQQKRISRDQAQRLLLFCNNCGPSFLFGILATVFPQQWMLWSLWGIQIGGSILMARLFPDPRQNSSTLSKESLSFSKSLSDSIRILGFVCAWVILLRIVLSFLQRWILWIFPKPMQVFLIGLLELSNGCCSLSAIEDLPLRFLICSVMLSFGGICVAMQTASAIGSLSVIPYLTGKTLQGLFTVCIVSSFIYHIPILLVFSALLFLILKKVLAKRKAIVYNGVINQRRNPYAVS